MGKKNRNRKNIRKNNNEQIKREIKKEIEEEGYKSEEEELEINQRDNQLSKEQLNEQKVNEIIKEITTRTFSNNNEEKKREVEDLMKKLVIQQLSEENGRKQLFAELNQTYYQENEEESRQRLGNVSFQKVNKYTKERISKESEELLKELLKERKNTQGEELITTFTHDIDSAPCQVEHTTIFKDIEYKITRDLSLLKDNDFLVEKFKKRFDYNDFIIMNKYGYALLSFMKFDPTGILRRPYCLDYIYINPIYRRKKYGFKLMEFIIENYQIAFADISEGFFSNCYKDLSLERLNIDHSIQDNYLRSLGFETPNYELDRYISCKDSLSLPFSYRCIVCDTLSVIPSSRPMCPKMCSDSFLKNVNNDFNRSMYNLNEELRKKLNFNKDEPFFVRYNLTE